MKIIWANLYANNTAFYYDTKSEADIFGLSHRLGNQAWRLEIEE